MSTPEAIIERAETEIARLQGNLSASEHQHEVAKERLLPTVRQRVSELSTQEFERLLRVLSGNGMFRIESYVEDGRLDEINAKESWAYGEILSAIIVAKGLAQSDADTE